MNKYFLFVLVLIVGVFIIIYGLLCFISYWELKMVLLTKGHDPNLTKIDENVRKLQDAVTVIKRYKEIIKTQKKRIVTPMKNQGQTLKK